MSPSIESQPRAHQRRLVWLCIPRARPLSQHKPYPSTRSTRIHTLKPVSRIRNHRLSPMDKPWRFTRTSLLQIGQIENWRRRFADRSIAGVLHNSDDLYRRVVAQSEDVPKSLVQAVLADNVPARQGLIDDSNLRRFRSVT